jgi:hypothetical protein
MKHKFSFKNPYKDKKRVWYKCFNDACSWKVTAHLNCDDENEVIVDSVIAQHTCISDATAKGGAATVQVWI